jgi:hypothetical protein
MMGRMMRLATTSRATHMYTPLQQRQGTKQHANVASNAYIVQTVMSGTLLNCSWRLPPCVPEPETGLVTTSIDALRAAANKSRTLLKQRSSDIICSVVD